MANTIDEARSCGTKKAQAIFRSAGYKTGGAIQEEARSYSAKGEDRDIEKKPLGGFKRGGHVGGAGASHKAGQKSRGASVHVHVHGGASSADKMEAAQKGLAVGQQIGARKGMVIGAKLAAAKLTQPPPGAPMQDGPPGMPPDAGPMAGPPPGAMPPPPPGGQGFKRGGKIGKFAYGGDVAMQDQPTTPRAKTTAEPGPPKAPRLTEGSRFKDGGKVASQYHGLKRVLAGGHGGEGRIAKAVGYGHGSKKIRQSLGHTPGGHGPRSHN